MATGASTQTLRPRPLSVAEVLRATFQVYRRGFLPFSIVAGIAAVPDAIFSAGYEWITAYTDASFESRQSFRTLAMSLLVRCLSLLAYWSFGSVTEALFGGVATVLAVNLILGRSTDVAAACRRVLRRIGSLVLVVGVLWFAFFGLAIAVLGIPFAIYVGLGWMLASQAILLEELGWRDALRRSWEMVRWHRWRLLACILVLCLVQIIPSVALYNIPSCLLSDSPGGSSWLLACPEPRDASVLQKLGNAVHGGLVGALSWPLTPIFATLLYYDLRVRDERLDLDLRAAASGEPPGAQAA